MINALRFPESSYRPQHPNDFTSAAISSNVTPLFRADYADAVFDHDLISPMRSITQTLNEQNFGEYGHNQSGPVQPELHQRGARIAAPIFVFAAWRLGTDQLLHLLGRQANLGFEARLANAARSTAELYVAYSYFVAPWLNPISRRVMSGRVPTLRAGEGDVHNLRVPPRPDAPVAAQSRVPITIDQKTWRRMQAISANAIPPRPHSAAIRDKIISDGWT